MPILTIEQPTLLANVQLFQAGMDASQSVSEQWQSTWDTVIGGDSISGSVLYSALSNVGVIFAVGSLALYSIQFARKHFLDESPESLIFDPILVMRWVLVALLLGNGGELLRTGMMAAYDSFHELNQQVLEITVTGVRLDEVYREAQQMGNAQVMISQYVRQCDGTSGEKQQQCLENALAQSEELIRQMEQVYGSGNWFTDRLDDLAQIRQAIAESPNALMSASPIYWAIAGPIWETVAYTILWAWQGAFQSGVELVSVIVALFSPLAVGGAILPMGGPGALGLWLTGFISISLLKLSFNIAAGLAAVTFTNSAITDPLVFPFLVAVFAPAFSVLVFTGGAWGVWSGMTSLVEKASTGVLRLV
jgi:hypothetical protein